MAWTSAENTRVTAIETMLNKVQTAISKLMTKQQMRQLLLIKQKEVDALTLRVAALEEQVAALQSKLD